MQLRRRGLLSLLPHVHRRLQPQKLPALDDPHHRRPRTGRNVHRHHGAVRSEQRRRTDVSSLRLRRQRESARLRHVLAADVRFKSNHRACSHFLQQERSRGRLPRHPVASHTAGQCTEPQLGLRLGIQPQRLSVGYQRQRGHLQQDDPPPS